MSTFSVLGVDRDTRKERVVVVEAGSEDQAAESALEHGLAQVKGVRAFDGPKPVAAHLPWYADQATAFRLIVRAVKHGVFWGLVWFAILSSIVWFVVGLITW